jgi:hypothetical protein
MVDKEIMKIIVLEMQKKQARRKKKLTSTEIRLHVNTFLKVLVEMSAEQKAKLVKGISK